MKNYERKLAQLEQLMGRSDDIIEKEDLGDGTYMLKNEFRGACVILPEQKTAAEWNASLQGLFIA